jgi:hypothetical protein
LAWPKFPNKPDPEAVNSRRPKPFSFITPKAGWVT